MGIAFASPSALLLLLPALGFTFLLHTGTRRRLGARRRFAALAVRTLILLALVFALAGFQLVLPVDRLATVFVVDLSDSVGQAGHQDALGFVRQSLAAMPKDDLAGIVAFGEDALVERLPESLADVDQIHSTPVRSATDIGAALRLASALFPDDAQKRIVLVSDGNDTTGGGQSEAALAAARGVQIETHAVGLGSADEVLVERLTTPSTGHVGEEIEATVQLHSSVAQPATVRLFADRTLVGTQRIDLPIGESTVKFLVKPTEAGFHTFRAVVEAGRDTFGQNNQADSDTIVKGEPRILVAAGDETVAGDLVKALTEQRQKVDVVIPEAVPSDLAELSSYDSVVLVDVPRARLSDAQLGALQVDVRDLGKGLVMVGGPHSYGAGGYQKTPLEETLPVEMGVRNRQKEPDVALVVVIDQSGSMDACHCNSFNMSGNRTGIGGVRKVDIGKEAILRAAAALSAKDELGVVGFNEAAHWVVHTQPLGNISDLQGQIAGIQPAGQTNIFAGLDQAVQSLEGATATRRHIILLTDGWSTSGQYADILARMKADGITLSTVGAGGGANPFLEQLAKEGGGRFYAAVNESTIPDVFLKETQQVAGQQIVEEPFHPILTGDSPILRGIDGGFPQLLGYDGTTPKSAAQTVLVTGRDDPLLAQWQYGLGRSVAWTSDTTGRWAKNWLGWQNFSRFFSQLVSWTFPGEETGGIEAQFVDQGGQTRLRVQSVASDGNPRDFYATSATVVGPDLTPTKVDLDQVAPGVYETSLGRLGAGAYAVRITQTRPGNSALGRTVGLVAPTSAEYRLLGTNDALLAALRSATGGAVAADPAAVWRHDLATTGHLADLWPLLLVLAMLLWPLDVALRRVSVGRRELLDARAWVSRGWRGRRARAARTVVVGEMLAAKDRASGASARAALLRGDGRSDVPTAAGSAPRASTRSAPRAPAPGSTGSSASVEAAVAGSAPRAPAPGSTGSSASMAEPVAGRVAVPDTPRGDPRVDGSPAAPADQPDTLARLREAKRRARDR